MKSKKATYGLILAVLLIWGIVIYKAFLEKKEDVNYSPLTSQSISLAKDSSMVLNEFELLLNYKDPFFTSSKQKIKVYSPQNSGEVKQVVTTKSKKDMVKTILPISINHIKYFGVIKNQNKGKAIGVLYIGTNEYLVNENLKVEGVLIKEIREEELEFEYQSELFIIQIED